VSDHARRTERVIPLKRRDEIVDAAEVVVAELGADAFSTGILAERADVPLSTVYRYFTDRFHILDALRSENGAVLVERMAEAGLAPHPAVASAQMFHEVVVEFYRSRRSARHLRPGGADDDAWWWRLASTMHAAVGGGDRRATLRACRLHVSMVHASFARDADGDPAMLTQALRAFCFLIHAPASVRLPLLRYPGS
jgi:AcrR family transcriptional regulator